MALQNLRGFPNHFVVLTSSSTQLLFDLFGCTVNANFHSVQVFFSLGDKTLGNPSTVRYNYNRHS